MLPSTNILNKKITDGGVRKAWMPCDGLQKFQPWIRLAHFDFLSAIYNGEKAPLTVPGPLSK